MNYKVLIADEAMADIFRLVQYIHTDLCNPDVAEKLYYNLNREVKNMGDFPLKFSDAGIKHRGYIIHKKVYESYLIFYIVSNEKQEIYVLRVIKDLMNWKKILNGTKIYHFSSQKGSERMLAAKVQDTAEVNDATKLEFYRLIGEGYKAMQDGRTSTIEEVREKIVQRRKDRRG